MQKEECVGCKTHFEEGCKLPMEGLSIELKNYPIPIKDQKHRWVLLKTICSLLNSKGGTIFIGADDSTGEVRGVSIQRKDRDDFKIFIQQLSERIQPKVDLSDR
jgi:predicted HTH transcriptional regulator